MGQHRHRSSTACRLASSPDISRELRWRTPHSSALISTTVSGDASFVKLRGKLSRRVSRGNSPKAKVRTRQLDETVVVEPVDNDVLCGRGGFTNTHPGNIRFREKALELRPWYERSSKEEKQRIADLLVESITSQGYRFLGKGKDGLWHEMVHGAHRKASQALRERIKR